MNLAPSILSANFYNLQNDFEILKSCGIKYLHLDVMDGMFVPNITFGMPLIKSIKTSVNDDFILDTHLMVERPERFISDFKNVGSDILTIHAESTKDFAETVSIIKSLGMKSGISINPETDVHKIDECLRIVDYILIMSVHPGFSGQKFVNESIDKIRYFSDIKKKNGFNYVIEVDGGVKLDNIKNVIDAGAELIVAGSAIFNGDIKKNINDFKKIMETYNL